MSECEFCAIESSELDAENIYEDDKVRAVLHLKPASKGHIILYPKQHHPIIEEVPDDVAGHMFYIANKLSIALFEALEPKGTNIIIENGVAAGQNVPHVSVNIVPRNDNDNLNLQWTPKKLDNPDDVLGKIVPKAGAQEEMAEVEEKSSAKDTKSEQETYIIKQLKRIP